MLSSDQPVPCSSDPELWFSKRKANIAQAKAICATCPIVVRCLTQALETEEALGEELLGVHGMTTPAERRALKLAKTA